MILTRLCLTLRHRCWRSSSGLATALAIVASNAPVLAEGIEPPTRGQTVYVPIYSELRHGNVAATGRTDVTLLSVLVSVRNTDPLNPIRVVSANYYNTEGVLLRNSLPAPRVIPPFGTFELFVEQRENQGGSGANYAIKWDATAPVSQPTIEALHSRFQAGYSVAFISRGRAISEP
ncbi:MAG TPA: DUF3124 domain-containing protein [Candidatus Accumulibacter phosphatis]|nr:MAG: hypothetical protein AW07_01427 [Candidatus Accumulibacter sp. SK-11]HAY26908.1 hypothetical protein [Accumulibacter sp.]HRL78611.1 DUF3124 domain-containing protein [Candidatus Accumulibacter phosphatis]HCN66982.1 hypothetical protein [Accumulibacter sp.]HCV12844.1 hypothetical protein [Accumulibacter sp.]